MTKITPDQISRFETLSQEYEILLNDDSSNQQFSEDEQSILDQVAEQFDKIKTIMKAAEEASEHVDNQGAIEVRKTGRLNKIKDMRSSIMGLMSSLKSAR